MADEVKYKVSRYNHFVEDNNGKVLAFNAMSCGLGEMDKENYEIYQKIVNGEITDYTQVPPDLFEKLKQGNFIISETTDEIQKLKAGHFAARFANRGFGLTIIPTLECNFACDYCYEPDNPKQERPKREPMSKEVQDGIVELVKNRLQEGTMFSVSWYGGEPLLELEVIESLTERFKKVCKEKKAKYGAGIITNGYLLTPTTLDKLIKLNISFAQITIDGPEEIHNARRPLLGKGPTYQTIIDNITKIPEDIPFGLSIRVNIDRRNREYVSELLENLRGHDLHNKKNISIYFSSVFASTNSCKDVIESCMITREFALKEVELYREAMRIGFQIKNYPASNISLCGAIGPNSFVVEPDGILQTCWNTVGRKDTKVGSIKDSSIELNDNYNKWLSWSTFDKKGCKNCPILPLCMGGCPYKNIYSYELAPSERSTCMSYKYNLKHMIQLYSDAYRLGLFVPLKRQKKKEEESKSVKIKE